VPGRDAKPYFDYRSKEITNLKIQIPNNSQASNSKFGSAVFFEIWDLNFVWSLGFGIWNFRFAAVPLSGQWNPTTEAFHLSMHFSLRSQTACLLRLRTLSELVARPLQ
jgi:hypothetical protein